uniref:PX domain-containing protein n=1 Tax=Eptatretus burgeri TaxID=7764 RepID=A0A8C4PY92_EPTBU
MPRCVEAQNDPFHVREMLTVEVFQGHSFGTLSVPVDGASGRERKKTFNMERLLQTPQEEEEEESRGVSVVGSELLDSYTVYIIEVTSGRHQWTVKHRYSDFRELHDKLAIKQQTLKELLPPKTVMGKNAPAVVARRAQQLQVYLRGILGQQGTCCSAPVADFLLMHVYDLVGVTTYLAEYLFNKGEEMLEKDEEVSFSPLQLHAIAWHLRRGPLPYGVTSQSDLGNILDFACRLKYLKVEGTLGTLGSSNIEDCRLPFDLSIFKALQQLKVSDCDIAGISGLEMCKGTLTSVSMHHCTSTIQDVLFREVAVLGDWEVQGTAVNPEDKRPGPAARVPPWSELTMLDLSDNSISYIDTTLKLTPKLQHLDLRNNNIKSIENLQHLSSLSHLDLSGNKLAALPPLRGRLGNVRVLCLAANGICSVTPLVCLYSLVSLNLASNALNESCIYTRSIEKVKGLSLLCVPLPQLQ